PAKKKGQPPVIFDQDEGPREDTTIEALRALKPAFKKDGTVTAGNAPGVNDGAAALVVTSGARAKELGVKAMVRIVAQATSGVEPKWVMMALGHPIGASGARVLVTLIYEMMRRDVHRGIAALCLGGGNAVAMAVER